MMNNLMREKAYISMLLDTLIKKNQLLDELIILTQRQKEELKNELLDDIVFTGLLEKKEEILQQLNRFEEGFETLYQKVGQQLQVQKSEYKNEIQKMQELIPNITDKSVQLKALEVENKQLIEIYLKKERVKVKEFKVNRQAASNYYKTMANLQTGESYFMDKKK